MQPPPPPLHASSRIDDRLAFGHITRSAACLIGVDGSAGNAPALRASNIRWCRSASRGAAGVASSAVGSGHEFFVGSGYLATSRPDENSGQSKGYSLGIPLGHKPRPCRLQNQGSASFSSRPAKFCFIISEIHAILSPRPLMEGAPAQAAPAVPGHGASSFLG